MSKIIAVILLAVWSADIIEKRSGIHDPSIVVIDEVAGMWCSLLAVPQIPWHYVTAFVIFRLIDIAKPGPIRRLQKWPGGWGITMDDLAAGMVTILMLIFISIMFSLLTFRRGLDPDNVVVPLLTTIGDLIGISTLLLITGMVV